MLAGFESLCDTFWLVTRKSGVKILGDSPLELRRQALQQGPLREVHAIERREQLNVPR